MKDDSFFKDSFFLFSSGIFTSSGLTNRKTIHPNVVEWRLRKDEETLKSSYNEANIVLFVSGQYANGSEMGWGLWGNGRRQKETSSGYLLHKHEPS